MIRPMTIWLTLTLLLVSCTNGEVDRVSDSTNVDIDMSLIELSDELATAISSLDAARVTAGVRDDDHVVYVSDGQVIRGHEFYELLHQFYAGMERIDFHWEKREVNPIGNNAGVVTGWASILYVSQDGSSSTDKAIFSLVYGRTAESWEFVTAHKTTIQ